MVEIDKWLVLAQLRYLPVKDLLPIAQECIELMATGDAKDYSEANAIPLRTVQGQIQRSEVPCLVISGKKFPCINIF